MGLIHLCIAIIKIDLQMLPSWIDHKNIIYTRLTSPGLHFALKMSKNEFNEVPFLVEKRVRVK